MSIDLVAEKEKRLIRYTQTCRHFNGIQNDKCEVGIDYRAVRNTETKPFSYPCLNPDCVLICASADRYTREEAEAREIAIFKSLSNIAIARNAILESCSHRRNYSSAINCPVCGKGILSFSVASNGHIHARCSQPDCVRWME